MGLWLLVTTSPDQCELRSWTSLPLLGGSCKQTGTGKRKRWERNKKKLFSFPGGKVALLKEILLSFLHFQISSEIRKDV